MKTKFEFISVDWFATSMAPYRTLDERESVWAMLDFVEKGQSKDLEQVAIWLMPLDFTRIYLRYRRANHQKEAFRRAWLHSVNHHVPVRVNQALNGNDRFTPVQLAVVEHIRKHKTFHPSRLGEVLGHPPTEAETSEANRLLTTLTDKQWQAILR